MPDTPNLDAAIAAGQLIGEGYDRDGLAHTLDVLARYRSLEVAADAASLRLLVECAAQAATWR